MTGPAHPIGRLCARPGLLGVIAVLVFADLTLATDVDMTAATAGPALAAPTFNENNGVGIVLSGVTPEDFGHGWRPDARESFISEAPGPGSVPQIPLAPSRAELAELGAARIGYRGAM